MLPPSELYGGLNETSWGPSRGVDVLSVLMAEVVQRLEASVTNYFPEFAEESKGRLRDIANEAYVLADQCRSAADTWSRGV